jgi:hypothetical protein
MSQAALDWARSPAGAPPVPSFQSFASLGSSGTFSVVTGGSSLPGPSCGWGEAPRVRLIRTEWCSGGEAPRGRLIRTGGQGNPEWCRHSLGTGDTQTNTDGLYDLVQARTLLRDLVSEDQDISTIDGQPSTMNREVIKRWRSEIQGPMRTSSRTRPPPRQHVTLFDDASDDEEIPSLISPGFSEPAEPPSPSLDMKYAVGDSDQRAWRQSLPAGLWNFIVILKIGFFTLDHDGQRSTCPGHPIASQHRFPGVPLDPHRNYGALRILGWSRSAVVENRKRRGHWESGYVGNQKAPPEEGRWLPNDDHLPLGQSVRARGGNFRTHGGRSDGSK